MPATVKCDTIKEVNSAVDNLALDSSGNVTIGNNLTVTGTTTQTGSTTFTGPTYFPNGSVSAPSIAHAGDTNCGLYFGTDTIYAATAGTNALTIDSSQNMTVANTLVMGSSFKRNRIINGDMRVDQRATAATTNDAYTVDRWKFTKNNDATESVAQNTDAPTGFSYSLRNTVSVGDTSIGANQYSGFRQIIEGYNVADLSFGTASAKTITISFWVKATQAGTYAVTLFNNAVNRLCWKSYTVNNTSGVGWEYKTLTFTGDTTGTWETTTGGGLFVDFWFALGSDFKGGSDGVWSSAVYLGPSGMTNGIGTNGNIIAITGVQLEVGSVATPYERQIYSDQLAQCQRYYQRFEASNGYTKFGTGVVVSTTVCHGITVPIKVQMRAAPTILNYSNVVVYDGLTSATVTSIVNLCSSASISLDTGHSGGGLTAGRPGTFGANNLAYYFDASAEL